MWVCLPFAVICTKAARNERKNPSLANASLSFTAAAHSIWLQGDGEISNIKHGMSNARRGQIQYQQIAHTVEYGRQQTNNQQYTNMQQPQLRAYYM